MGEKLKPVSEEKQYQYNDKKLEDLVPRVRDEVKEVQDMAKKTMVRSLYNEKKRSSFAKEFSKKSIAFLEELEEKGQLPYKIFNEDKEKIYEYFADTVKLHVAVFSKANGDSLSGTLFDLDNPTDENIKDRGIYVSELMSIALENSMALGGKDKKGFKLAKYRDSEWIREWMNGSKIREHLKEKSYSDNDIDFFLDSIPQNIRLTIAAGSIQNPEATIEKTADNFLNKLSDENLTKILKSEEGITDKEIRELLERYPKSFRMRTAISNINDPEGTFKKIINNYKEKLSNENLREILSETLNHDDLELFLQYYVNGYRMKTASAWINEPEKIAVKIAKNYNEKLSDENIIKILGDSKESADSLGNFPKSSRMQIAIININNPEKAIKKIVDNYNNKLSDKKIESFLVKKNFSKESVDNFIKRFPRNLRIRVATGNVNDPENAVFKTADSYINKLSDKKLEKILSDKDFSKEEVLEFLENFPENLRIKIAIKSVNKPEEAALKMANNYINKLSDKNLEKMFKDKGFSKEEIIEFLENYPKSSRIEMAYRSIKGDPERNAEKVFDNYKKLSNSELLKALSGKEYSEEEKKDFLKYYTKSYRVEMASRNIKDSMGSFLRIADNYINKLSDKKLLEVLKEERYDKEESEKFIKKFTESYRMIIAFKNINSSEEAFKIIADNYMNELSDYNLKKVAREKGIDYKEIENFWKNNPRISKIQIAVHNIKNPVAGIFDRL